MPLVGDTVAVAAPEASHVIVASEWVMARLTFQMKYCTYVAHDAAITLSALTRFFGIMVRAFARW